MVRRRRTHDKRIQRSRREHVLSRFERGDARPPRFDDRPTLTARVRDSRQPRFGDRVQRREVRDLRDVPGPHQPDVEDRLASGQRGAHVVAADLTLSRPDKRRAQRQGEPVNQVFYYDGKQLTLYDRGDQVYATVAAPPTLGAMLGFAQSSLGLVLPAADLLYPDAYPLLMEGVTSATVIGKSSIGGVSCDHLAFSRPGVDFQVWVADSGPALPYKYIVTDTGTPALLSVSIVMSDWSSDRSLSAAEFDFTPPPGTEKIDFMRIDSNTGLGH